MDHYVDISVLSDSEFPTTVLLSSLYAKLHKTLHDLATTNIGVSFPKYNITLGNILRIHGEQAVLHDLLGLNWLGGMSGYCDVSSVKPVPLKTKFRTVSRKQTTMSQSKLRRLVKRGSIMGNEIGPYKAKMLSKGIDNPYVELMSGSNGQKYRRYIEFGEVVEQPILGKFDQFGLSKTSTVPWFD